MTKKIGFVFPGQGCQSLGMGQELYTNYPQARAVFERASSALGMNMQDLCFHSSMEELSLTENTQPSILTVSIALYEILKSHGIMPHAVAGLSLGEYGALVAGGALSLEEGVSLVKTRGLLMQEEVAPGVGGLLAVIGLSQDKIQDIIAPLQQEGTISPTNINAKDQIVIGGEIMLLQEAQPLLKAGGARMTTFLKVSAPFHTSMLEGAGNKLRSHLENTSLRKPMADYYPNVLGKKMLWIDETTEMTTIKDEKSQMIQLLQDQVSHPVLWLQTIEAMIQDGVQTFVEVFPGKTLSSMIKKINKDVEVISLANIEDLEQFLAEQGDNQWAVSL